MAQSNRLQPYVNNANRENAVEVTFDALSILFRAKYEK